MTSSRITIHSSFLENTCFFSRFFFLRLRASDDCYVKHRESRTRSRGCRIAQCQAFDTHRQTLVDDQRHLLALQLHRFIVPPNVHQSRHPFSLFLRRYNMYFRDPGSTNLISLVSNFQDACSLAAVAAVAALSLRLMNPVKVPHECRGGSCIVSRVRREEILPKMIPQGGEIGCTNQHRKTQSDEMSRTACHLQHVHGVAVYLSLLYFRPASSSCCIASSFHF